VTNIKIGDIDLDCADRDQILALIDHIPASLTNGDKHKTGVYVQDIAQNPLTGYAAEDFEHAKYTKIDFLNLSTLKYFSSNEEIEELIAKEPNWDLLKIPEIVNGLPHIHSYFDLVQEINPRSVEDLMAVLDKIREHSDYKFKRSHNLAYCLNIIALMNYFEKTNTVPDAN
jgi:hypothetical protein